MDMGAKSTNDPASPSPEALVHREGDREHVDTEHVDRQHVDKEHVDIEHSHEHEHIKKQAMEAACRAEQRMKRNTGKIPGTRIFSK